MASSANGARGLLVHKPADMGRTVGVGRDLAITRSHAMGADNAKDRLFKSETAPVGFVVLRIGSGLRKRKRRDFQDTASGRLGLPGPPVVPRAGFLSGAETDIAAIRRLLTEEELASVRTPCKNIANRLPVQCQQSRPFTADGPFGLAGPLAPENVPEGFRNEQELATIRRLQTTEIPVKVVTPNIVYATLNPAKV